MFTPFDKLRANGLGLECIKGFPFMLSLSKHEDQLLRHALTYTAVTVHFSIQDLFFLEARDLLRGVAKHVAHHLVSILS